MNVITLDDVQTRHDDLYPKVIEHKEALKGFLQIKGREEVLDAFKNKQGADYKVVTELNVAINTFIGDLKKVSETVERFEDYRWLSNVAVKWHSVFSTILDAPRIVKLSQPKEAWLPSPSPNLTEEEIEDRLNNYKTFTFYAQQAEFNRSDEENAYRSAKEFLAYEILDGKMNFANRIASESYWRLEEIWVKELQALLAYFIWQKNERVLFREHEKHFFEATAYLRKKLINKEIKAGAREFQKAKEYIETCYIDGSGELRNVEGEKLEKLIREEAYRIYELTGYADRERNWKLAEVFIKGYRLGRCSKACMLKEEKFVNVKTDIIEKEAYRFFKITGYTDCDKNRQLAEEYVNKCRKYKDSYEGSLRLAWLIREKAHRIYETRTGASDMEHNWALAETYVKMFYENIIPAIEQDEKEKVLRVLKAFQYSKINGFLIKNCFELALAIYFLNPATIQSLWDEAKNEPGPETNVESCVRVRSWPNNFTIEEQCKDRFSVSQDRKEIDFKGVMLEVEKGVLLKALKAATAGKPEQEHIEAIQALFKQSRLIHEETTL